MNIVDQSEYKKSSDQYNRLNYYELPRLSQNKSALGNIAPNSVKNQIRANYNNSRTSDRNRSNFTFDRLQRQNNSYENLGFNTERINREDSVVSSPEFNRECEVFYGEENQDTLDKVMLRNKQAEDSRMNFLKSKQDGYNFQTNPY